MADKERISDLLNKLKDKDEEDYKHSLRVRDLVAKVLTQYKVSEKEKADILTAAVLHDIGNLLIPDYIIKKPGRLTLEEYEEVQKHVTKGLELIQDLKSFDQIKDVIKFHHENYNGFGYPDGIEGPEIPLGARIIHVLEAYDSMIVSRKSRKSVLKKEEAIKELKDYAGRMYDPEVVDNLEKVELN
ncbi:HD domain-containing protein [bacterium]|nr:HD domain-containing protein [bacterium]